MIATRFISPAKKDRSQEGIDLKPFNRYIYKWILKISVSYCICSCRQLIIECEVTVYFNSSMECFRDSMFSNSTVNVKQLSAPFTNLIWPCSGIKKQRFSVWVFHTIGRFTRLRDKHEWLKITSIQNGRHFAPFSLLLFNQDHLESLLARIFYPGNTKICHPILVNLLKTQPIIVNPVIKMRRHPISLL